MAAEAVPAPGAGRFRAGGAPADLLGGELCKVTEGETLDAPDGASATNSPEELLAAADSAATLPALGEGRGRVVGVGTMTRPARPAHGVQGAVDIGARGPILAATQHCCVQCARTDPHPSPSY